MFADISNILQKIKNNRPLILNITNDVTMNFIANGLLSLGASPVMSKAPEEAEDLVELAQSVVINPGTLDEKFIALSNQVCASANQLNKPIVLDPVGAGASRYRNETISHLLNHYEIAIIRGNASEIMSLAGAAIQSKGVDSTMQSDLAIQSGQWLSQQYHATVVISGETDIIIDSEQVSEFSYGSPLMPQITGTGCLMSAVLAAFHSIEKNRFEAAKLATVFYGICGEQAAKEANGPGSFKTKFIDQLSNIPTSDYAK